MRGTGRMGELNARVPLASGSRSPFAPSRSRERLILTEIGPTLLEEQPFVSGGKRMSRNILFCQPCNRRASSLGAAAAFPDGVETWLARRILAWAARSEAMTNIRAFGP
jgi:hypothetical protein